jgi:DNA mismatch repair protein MutL
MDENREQSVVKVLDDSTANKIAAGEVVERPASVVKELVENSLDAHATEIKIELVDGGKRLIRITDNGIGMTPRDAVLSLQRHATSKISSADDLFSITTLGFRGEALPSIASVSRFQMTTRRESDGCGTQITTDGGEEVEVRDAGSPVGTSICVEDLFFNVPARQKFLKTAQTELGHAIELVNRFIISHSGVSFALSHNDRTIVRSSASSREEDAILTVFGRDAAESVIPINWESGTYSVRGFVSRPSYSKQNRSGQLFFVNKRYVRNRNMFHAVDDAYRGILPQGRMPLFIGFIEVDPGLVDVNVHPTKIEVKFTKEWEVHSLIATSIRNALSSSWVAPTGEDILDKVPVVVTRPSFESGAVRHGIPVDGGASAPTLDMGAFRDALAKRLSTQEDPFVSQTETPVASMPVDAPSAAVQSDPLKGAVVLAQARNMYIVAQSAAGVLLVDQHVAHERILYDKLLSGNREIQVQRLVMPVTVQFGRREALVMENNLQDLRSMGFDIEPFGKETFAIRGVPVLISEKNYEQILRDTIDELTEMTIARRLMVHRDGIIKTTACKMAVKAGERLSIEEMGRLLSELRETSNPYLCPHGRPIVVCFSNRELDKMFGRM